jgi:Ca2+-binding EF-hand superfamily protein
MKIMAKYLLWAVFLVCLTSGISLGGSNSADGKGHKTGGYMMKKNFTDLDANSDGSLDFEEYKTAFPSSEKKAFDFLDSNSDNKLDREEWKTFTDMHKGMGKNSEEKYHDTDLPDPSGFNAHFGDMDTNHDSQVSSAEFQSYFSDKSKTDKVFSAVDTDQNGMLDHDEWHEFKAAHGLKHVE